MAASRFTPAFAGKGKRWCLTPDWIGKGSKQRISFGTDSQMTDKSSSLKSSSVAENTIMTIGGYSISSDPRFEFRAHTPIRKIRIAIVTVTSFELTFEIDAPEIVGGCGGSCPKSVTHVSLLICHLCAPTIPSFNFDIRSLPVPSMTSQTLLKTILLTLILAGASCAPVRPPTQLLSQPLGQAQGKPATSLTGKIEMKALPSPCAWMNAPKDFKILSEDSFSITASAKTDLYKDVDSGVPTATAPMLLFPAEDTFVLTTVVTVDFKQEYDGGFLVVYSDPDHWVKLLFEKSH